MYPCCIPRHGHRYDCRCDQYIHLSYWQRLSHILIPDLRPLTSFTCLTTSSSSAQGCQVWQRGFAVHIMEKGCHPRAGIRPSWFEFVLSLATTQLRCWSACGDEFYAKGTKKGPLARLLRQLRFAWKILNSPRTWFARRVSKYDARLQQ